MTTILRRVLPAVFTVIAYGASIQPAAAQVITNGGFESGFTGWTVVNQLGSDGTFLIQTGTVSPVSSTAVPAPPGPTSAAMSDALGSGSHVLYQDFVVPLTPSGNGFLRFDVFIGNRANAFFKPALTTLDFSTPALNQQARVDILTTTADPFSIAPTDVLFNAFQTNVGDPLVSGYTETGVDLTAFLTAHAGQTLRLRFAEVDNVFTFQMGVDNVSFTAVPEPSSLILCGIVATLEFARRKKRNRRPQ